MVLRASWSADAVADCSLDAPVLARSDDLIQQKIEEHLRSHVADQIDAFTSMLSMIEVRMALLFGLNMVADEGKE